jgi:MFS family permease
MPAGLFSIFWVNDLHATDGWIGLRGSAGYIALLVGYVFWGRTANRVGHRRMLLICGAGMACYPALTALAPSVQWLLPVALVWGVTAGGLDLGLFDMLLAACPAGRQPSFAAASSTCASVAVTVGPLMGAALAQTWNTRSALLAIAVLQLIATLAFLLLPGRQAENSE